MVIRSGSICCLGAKFHFRIHIERRGYDLIPSFASACFTELLTFIVNRLLNNDTSWRNSGIRFERNVVPKIQNYVETVFPISLPDVYPQTAG